MGKLTPAPKECRPKYSWKELDDTLQSLFKNLTCDMPRTTAIHFKHYDIDLNEMISELEAAGYEVYDKQDNYISIRIKD